MSHSNNKNTSQSVTCDKECMANMRALQPKADRDDAVALATSAGTYDVVEVWSNTKLAGAPAVKCTATECDALTVSVPAFGASTYVRLVPQGQ